MCDINSYDSLNTDLAGTGVLPSVANPHFLRVGFSLSISCKSADFAQPLGAKVTHSCDDNHEAIEIENCHSKFLFVVACNSQTLKTTNCVKLL